MIKKKEDKKHTEKELALKEAVVEAGRRMMEHGAALMDKGTAEMYEALEYIRMHNLQKASPRYKKTAFYTYLKDRWNITRVQYWDTIRILHNYPDKVSEFGIGLLVKMMKVCGKNVDKVLAEITKEAEAHKNPLSRMAIDNIILKNRADKGIKIRKSHTDWQAMYEHEKAAHARTQTALNSALAQLDALCAVHVPLAGQRPVREAGFQPSA